MCAPAHSTTKGVGTPPKPPCQLDPLISPHPHLFKGPACPPSRNKQEQVLFVFLPPAAAQVPIKPCLASYRFLLIKESKKPGW